MLSAGGPRRSSAGRGAVSGAVIAGAVGRRRGAAVGAATGAVVGRHRRHWRGHYYWRPGRCGFGHQADGRIRYRTDMLIDIGPGIFTMKWVGRAMCNV
jgi:hypothetical protein